MKFFISFFCPFLWLISSTLAAGFLDHLDGVPYKWQQKETPISYSVDKGGLGNLTNEEARAMVVSALKSWSEIPLGWGISFSEAEVVAEDINKTNYLSYITKTLRNVSDKTIIIFDSDGEITQDINGDNTGILGFSSPGKLDDNQHLILAGLAVFNANYSKSFDPGIFPSVMIHEFGHFLNLSHSQLNMEEYFSPDVSDNVVIPTMFPFLPSSPSGEDVFLSFEKEDEFSFGYLYPNQDLFNAKGGIQGKILRRKGEGVRGVEVICRSFTNPRKDAVSWISDQNLANPSQGEYFCGNLSSGSYTVEIKPIIFAINYFDPYPPFIFSEFYNGSGESFDPQIDLQNSLESVAVVEGEKTQGINIVLNENGRLISGQKITGTSKIRSNGDIYFTYSDLEYFITVPKGARSVRFELNGNGYDFDLYGRCDSEFSLSRDTVPPIYSPSNTNMQAEFAGVSSEDTETVEISSQSSPPIQPCTYHILIEPSLGVPVDASFELTATIRSDTPVLQVQKEMENTSSEGSGEFMVSHQRLTARGDTFRIHSLTLKDMGDGNLENVTAAKLYFDPANDGKLQLITQASSIDPTKREIIFSNFDRFLEEGDTQHWYISYTTSAAASLSSWFIWVIFAGIFWGGFRKKNSFVLVGLVLGMSFLNTTCSKEEKMTGYRPIVETGNSLTVKGLSFGDQVHVSVDPIYESIKDFFD